MDVVTYALCKKLASSAVSGIKGLQIDGTNLIITTNDGNTLTMEFPVPKDGENGLSIQNVTIDSNSHLICTMSDGSTIDAGVLPSGSGGEIDPSNLNYATNADIDKMFDSTGEIIPSNPFATNADIDKLFSE